MVSAARSGGESATRRHAIAKSADTVRVVTSLEVIAIAAATGKPVGRVHV